MSLDKIIVLYEMSQLLNCGVDQRTLTLLVALIENGVNPEALANVVKELQRETRALKVIIFHKKMIILWIYIKTFKIKLIMI